MKTVYMVYFPDNPENGTTEDGYTYTRNFRNMKTWREAKNLAKEKNGIVLIQRIKTYANGTKICDAEWTIER